MHHGAAEGGARELSERFARTCGLGGRPDKGAATEAAFVPG